MEQLGKTAASAEDFPAFIVNRILMPMINEAVYTLYEGVGNVASIDSAMKLGTNHPMGPLELADFIGLDTCLAIMNVLHDGLADTKYRPCPLLTKYVEAGWLGRKTAARLLRLSRRRAGSDALRRTPPSASVRCAQIGDQTPARIASTRRANSTGMTGAPMIGALRPVQRMNNLVQQQTLAKRRETGSRRSGRAANWRRENRRAPRQRPTAGSGSR